MSSSTAPSNLKRHGGPRLCKWHKKDAICDRCPEVTKTDGAGFPHTFHQHAVKGDALARTRLRICAGCEQPKTWNEWDRTTGQCLSCAGALTAGTGTEHRGTG